MSDLKKHLTRLGQTNPELADDVKTILSFMDTREAGMQSAYKDLELMPDDLSGVASEIYQANQIISTAEEQPAYDKGVRRLDEAYVNLNKLLRKLKSAISDIR